MTGQMASEGTSRGRQRPSHHLKACLRGFQRVYRAHILCEELKWENITTSKPASRPNDHFLNSRLLEATLVTSNLLDPHIWYSNDLPWPQDVKFDLDLGWPRRPRVTSEVQNRGQGQIWHPKVIWVESWVVLTWYFWGKPKILFSPNLSPTV